MITTSTLAKVKKGIDKIVITTPDDHPMQHDVIYGNAPTDRQKYITRDTVSGLGYAPEVPEGTEVTYDERKRMYSTNWTPVNYVQGWYITEQAKYNDIYSIEAGNATEARNCVIDTERKVGTLILANGFTDSDIGPDGGALFHTAVGAGSGNPTYASEFTTALALSDTALKAARYNLRRVKDARNRPRMFTGDLHLVVPPELEWTAETLLTTAGVVGSANNDNNVVKRGLSKLVLDDLTSATNWFLIAKDKSKHGLFKAVGMPMSSRMQYDIDVLAWKNVVFKQFVYGWDHSYSIWGSAA